MVGWVVGWVGGSLCIPTPAKEVDRSLWAFPLHTGPVSLRLPSADLSTSPLPPLQVLSPSPSQASHLLRAVATSARRQDLSTGRCIELCRDTRLLGLVRGGRGMMSHLVRGQERAAPLRGCGEGCTSQGVWRGLPPFRRGQEGS